MKDVFARLTYEYNDYRRMQHKIMKYKTYFESPIGLLTLLSDGAALTGVSFEEQKYDKSDFYEECQEKELPIFKQTKEWLTIYFKGEDPGALPPLFTQGTSFQEMVWQCLREIPYGKTITYGEIAAKIAEKKGLKRMSAQAVGQAVGRNPIGILQACHRVVGKDGRLTGFAGGLDKKEKLLKLEGFHVVQGKIIGQ